MCKLSFIFLTLFILGCEKVFKPKEEISLKNESIERFTVDVNTVDEQSDPYYEQDWGVLILPRGYSKDKQPVKLIMFCHGGGGSVYKDNSYAESARICKYLVSLGYAVMDMAGMPETYSSRLKIDHTRTLGHWISIRSYVSGYKYVTSNYNIDKHGCFLAGGSNSGLVTCNLVNFTEIPFIAQCGLSPLLSMEKNAWDISSGANSGGEYKFYQNRANLIKLYRMKAVTSQKELNNAAYEKEKVGKYDPYDYLINQTDQPYKIPFKIWHPKNDPVVLEKVSEAFVELVNKRKTILQLRTMEDGGHGPEEFGSGVVKYIFMGVEYEATQVMREVAAWYEAFGGYPLLK